MRFGDFWLLFDTNSGVPATFCGRASRPRVTIMGRKKRRGAQLKPFCYYCDREFDDEKVLIQHQKAKHFKCSECNRKLDTATGLVVHMLQVHKETISRVPNANSGRDNPEDIIHGMAGVPPNIINEKQAKLDEERGAAKHQKAAHTVFGMSVMSGFFNQMHNTPDIMPTGVPGQPGVGVAPGFSGTPSSTFLPGQAGMMPGFHNPYTFTQFVSQMSQNPQAAFNALANTTAFAAAAAATATNTGTATNGVNSSLPGSLLQTPTTLPSGSLGATITNPAKPNASAASTGGILPSGTLTMAPAIAGGYLDNARYRQSTATSDETVCWCLVLRWCFVRYVVCSGTLCRVLPLIARRLREPGAPPSK